MTQQQPKVLFILKQRMPGPYGSWSYSAQGTPLASGLNVSAGQMAKALDELGIENKLVHVVDNNCIDREVHAYRPTHVIIEAFWVVPEKFDVLSKLHPTVTWIVRNHSKLPFLANEGGMIGWAVDYMLRGVIVGSNSPEATRDLRALGVAAGASPCSSVFLPNYYQTNGPKHSNLLLSWNKLTRWLGFNEGVDSVPTELNIGCFGAVRPMKNHLSQAVAALEAAEYLGAKLHFWVNGNRVEGKGESFLRSVRELFKRYPKHELHELDWMPHDEFVKVIAKMDLVMQVSNSETFNIVAADAVANHVPVIGSSEIPWLNAEYVADPSDINDMRDRVLHVISNKRRGLLQEDQLRDLKEYTEHAKMLWSLYLLGVCKMHDHSRCPHCL